MATAKPRIFTIGHSTRSFPEFADLLETHGVRELVDVRSVPRSRHTPQFNETTLEKSLEARGIRYRHINELGGLRHAKSDSKNTGWRNASFRGYADYMGTPEFRRGLGELETLAKDRVTAIMCAEAVPWRCHRSMIADALIVDGWEVHDIMTKTSAPAHKKTSFLKVRKGELTYPPPAGPLL